MAYLEVSKGGRRSFFLPVVHTWEIQYFLVKKVVRYKFFNVRI
jgi:hypothetical protein